MCGCVAGLGSKRSLGWILILQVCPLSDFYSFGHEYIRSTLKWLYSMIDIEVPVEYNIIVGNILDRSHQGLIEPPK